MEALGKELNNFSCYILGTMLYVNIQKDVEATKTVGFHKNNLRI